MVENSAAPTNYELFLGSMQIQSHLYFHGFFPLSNNSHPWHAQPFSDLTAAEDKSIQFPFPKQGATKSTSAFSY